MESAFGVEHGEVSKGVPKGLVAMAAKGTSKKGVLKANPSKETLFAHERLQAHKLGRQAGKQIPHLFDSERGLGHQARQRARVAMI